MLTTVNTLYWFNYGVGFSPRATKCSRCDLRKADVREDFIMGTEWRA